MEAQIRNLLSSSNQEQQKESQDTVFAELMNSKLPPHELSQHRLQNEAVSVIGAGFETTRWALTVQSYFILANPDIHQRLSQELREVIPDPDFIPSWSELQKLPYLSACIEEGRFLCLHPTSSLNFTVILSLFHSSSPPILNPESITQFIIH